MSQAPIKKLFELAQKSLDFDNPNQKLLELLQKSDLILTDTTGKPQALCEVLPLLREANFRAIAAFGVGVEEEVFEHLLSQAGFELQVIDKQKFISKSLEEIKGMFEGVERRNQETKKLLGTLF